MTPKRICKPPQCRTCRWLLEHRRPDGRMYWCVVKEKEIGRAKVWRRACADYKAPPVRPA